MFYHFVHSTFFLSNLKHFLSLMLLFFILFMSCSPHSLTNSEFLIFAKLLTKFSSFIYFFVKVNWLLKDILQHFKFVNWRIRFLMSRTGYSKLVQILQFKIGNFVKPCGEQIIRNLFSTFMHILLSICLALDLLSSKSQIWNRGCSISKSTMQSSISKWDHKFINSKEPSSK